MPRRTPLLALLALLLLAACAQGSGPLRPSGVGAPPPATSDRLAIGRPDAPDVVVEYTDYQCPFCATFARETQPQIIAEYVDRGQVAFVFRDLPLTSIHPGALQAAHAARCAAAQGGFWPMHQRLFEGAERREWGGGGDADLAVFADYADALKLDGAALRQCVADQRYAGAIAADIAEATASGFNSTPTFLIGGQKLLGAQPFGVWRQAIEAQLR